MDKYEYNLKLDQIKTLCAEGNYKDAADIADTINWNKIKNVNALVKAGEVYENVGRYEESRELFLNAYDRSPIGRTIICRLAEVAIKMNDFDGAKECYDEFVDIAPHDNQRYVLKYNIRKAQGADVEELIPILEEFKEEEYTEEWAYELASLYHKAGMTEKCVDACDELILWFGDGPYVERALKLKMLHQPLTKAQETKYKLFHREDSAKENENLEVQMPQDTKEEMVEETKEDIKDKMSKAMEVQQVALDSNKFNTLNLQDEIVKGMQELMENAEKEQTVQKTDSLKEITKELPYLNFSADGKLITDETTDEIGDEPTNLKGILKEETDGQMSLVMKERALLEKQITGQMNITDVLAELEKTKQAAEEMLQKARRDNLNSEHSMVLKEAEDIMMRLSDVIPKIEAVQRTAPWKSSENSQRQTGMEEAFHTDVTAQERALLGLDIEGKQFDTGILPTIEEPVFADEIDFRNEPEDLAKDDTQLEPLNMLSLTEEQKAIFSYFMPVKGMEVQLCKALAGIVENLNNGLNASVGNLILQGSQGCGKTVLATSIVKVLQKECGKPSGRIGKIDAEALNKKDIRQLFQKVSEGCLIIERAGSLSRESAITLSLLLEQEGCHVFVILEDTAVGIKKVLGLDSGFARKFTQQVTVPIFTNEDYIVFAKSYANELGYVIDELAILALHNCISNIQRIDQATTLVEIKDIIDEAIEREARSGLRKAFNILTAKRYTDDDKIVLTEKDFQ